jgi:DNA repair exonuclease SbcCD nuclease subunit
MKRRPLSFIHSSDLHIGASTGQPNLEVLRKVLAVANEARVDTVLLAGDIFDNNRIAQAILDDAATIMAESRAAIVILPGNHDCLLADGVYERGDFERAGVTVLGATNGEVAALHGLGLTVWGRPHREHNDLLPLRDAPEFDPANWRVTMAHGHWVQTSADERRAYRIFDEDLDALSADYVALGHWDVFKEVREAAPAYYSGSPLYAGSVNLVQLDDEHPPSVKRLPIE